MTNFIRITIGAEFFSCFFCFLQINFMVAIDVYSAHSIRCLSLQSVRSLSFFSHECVSVFCLSEFLDDLLLFFNDLFGWKWILFTGFGMFQFGCIEILDAIDEIQFLLLLFDCCKVEENNKLDIWIRCDHFGWPLHAHRPSQAMDSSLEFAHASI